MNRLEQITGFTGLDDFLGKTFYATIPTVLKLSSWGGAGLALIERLTGLNFEFLVVLLLGSFLDMIVGVIVNIWILGEEWSTKKFERGVFKLVIAPSILLLTMQLKSGFDNTNIKEVYIRHIIDYATASIHYGALFFIILFLIIGIVENLDKAGIKSMNRIMSLLNITDKETLNKIRNKNNNKNLEQ